MYCHRCDSDLTGKNPWVQVTGYIKFRPTGGANQVQLKEQTGRLLCESCLVSLKGQHTPNQMTLDG